MGLLDQFTQAVDARKRYYGNMVRGLLDNPQALMEQLRAQNAENVTERARSAQEAQSVMPGIAEPAQRAAFDEAINMGLLGITAYHGSPHKFDKFDMSKIGTGEGAQAYGHGLYFAENPAVAGAYRDTLSDADGVLPLISARQQAIAHFQKKLDSGADPDLYKPQIKAMQAEIADMQKNVKSGALYKVDIPDEAVAKMLDWDKPLSQQPKAVRKGVRELINRGKNEAANGPFAMDGVVTTSGRSTRYATTDVINELDGASILQMLKRVYGNQAESELRSLGIPGIRYLDAGSRGKGGTSNFVLFDDELPKIIGRE